MLMAELLGTSLLPLLSSAWFVFSRGVQQGSFLGPLLFPLHAHSHVICSRSF